MYLCFRPALSVLYSRSRKTILHLQPTVSAKSLRGSTEIVKVVHLTLYCCLPQIKIERSKNNYSEVQHYIANAFFDVEYIYGFV